MSMRLVTFSPSIRDSGQFLSLACREVCLPSFPFLTTATRSQKCSGTMSVPQPWSHPGLFSSSSYHPPPTPCWLSVEDKQPEPTSSRPLATSRPRHHCLILGSHSGLCLLLLLSTAQQGLSLLNCGPQPCCPAPAPWSLWAEGSLHPGRPDSCPVLPQSLASALCLMTLLFGETWVILRERCSPAGPPQLPLHTRFRGPLLLSCSPLLLLSDMLCVYSSPH